MYGNARARARLHGDPGCQHRHRQHDARQSHDVKPAHAPPEVTNRTKQGAAPYSAYMGDALSGVLGPLGALDVRLLRAVRTQLLAREHSASASRCVEAGAQIPQGASETT